MRIRKRSRLRVAELDASLANRRECGSARLADQVRTWGVALRQEIRLDFHAARLVVSEAVFKLERIL